MQERSLVLVDGPKLRREKQIPRFARDDKSACETPALACRAEARPLQEPRSATSHLDRSIGSGKGSRENSTHVRETSTCTRLEQMRRRERLRNSAESSQPRAWRRRRKAVRSVVPPPGGGAWGRRRRGRGGWREVWT